MVGRHQHLFRIHTLQQLTSDANRPKDERNAKPLTIGYDNFQLATHRRETAHHPYCRDDRLNHRRISCTEGKS